MKKALLFLVACFCLYGAAWAQPTAIFAATTPANCSLPALIVFSSTSVGQEGHPITMEHWEFGDGTMADGGNNFSHIYTVAGVYRVTLVVTNDQGSDTASRDVHINALSLTNSVTYLGSSCSKIIEQFSVSVQSAAPDSLSYEWRVTGGTPNNLLLSDNASVIDSFNTPAETQVSLTVTSQSGNYCTYNLDTIYTTATPILPAKGPNVVTANRECLSDYDGWTNYYYDNNTPADESDDSLLLSLRLLGEDVGTVGDGTFSVTVGTTPAAGSNSATLVTNPVLPGDSNFFVMNRYWKVNATRQPTQPVGVRFYFNNQDFTDVQASYEPTGHSLPDAHQLLFYKLINGNPDPATNLAGADSAVIIKYSSSFPTGDETNWVDFRAGDFFRYDKQVAEFMVSSLTGGGGGGIYNSTILLPVRLTSFTAANTGSLVKLVWTSAQEINVAKYNVQVSSDGKQFVTLGTVAAHGNTSPGTYTFAYDETTRTKAYYRLQVVEKDGTASNSSVAFLSFAKAANIVLYPNPAKNSVQIKAAGFEGKRIIADVYNTAGTKVSAASLYFTAGTATLNTSALVSGHYTVVLRDEQSVTHLPLMIVR